MDIWKKKEYSSRISVDINGFNNAMNFMSVFANEFSKRVLKNKKTRDSIEYDPSEKKTIIYFYD